MWGQRRQTCSGEIEDKGNDKDHHEKARLFSPT